MRKIIITMIVVIAGILFIISGFLLFRSINISTPDKLELSYPYVGRYQNDFISVSDGNMVYYLDINGQKKLSYKRKITDNEILERYYFKDGYGITSKDDLYGVIDKNGKVIIKPTYSKIDIIDQNTFLVEEDNGDSYFVNQKNKKINHESYYNVFQLTSGLFQASKNGKVGVINKTGNIMIPFIYDSIAAVYDDSIFVAMNIGGDGTVYEWNGKKMKSLTLPQFVSCYDDEYLYLKDKNKKNYLYHYKTKKLITLNNTYETLGKFSNELISVSVDGETLGFINRKEELVIPTMYSNLVKSNFNRLGYAVVAKKENSSLLYGIIDQNNKEIVPFVYDHIMFLSEDLVAILTHDIYMLKTLSNKSVTNKQYKTLETTIRNDLYLVSVGDFSNLKYGLIDNTGKEIYEPKYKSITVYSDQLKLEDVDKYWIDLTL